MKSKLYFAAFLLIVLFSTCHQVKTEDSDTSHLHRIIVSTDIGGTDYDDYQSMVHLLLYADTVDLEGIISSPYGNGRKIHILQVIDEYEKDYPKLVSYSSKYPTAESLRRIVKQGATSLTDPSGISTSTEGSQWIVQCARRDDPRPLHILVWGGIEDLAQALHDAPEILRRLRVYFIGGPNKKWSVSAYQYIVENFPQLWMIESNATYRGWFVGGNQSGSWGNREFVDRYIKDSGALGKYFHSAGKPVIKMGDTPSLARLLKGAAEDPSQESWGGQYVRAWERPHTIYHRLTTELDSIEEFGVLELLLPFDSTGTTNPYAIMKIDREIKGLVMADSVKFLFSPKKAGKFSYKIESNIPTLSKKEGTIISYPTPPENINKPSPLFPNWWTDDPSPEYREGNHIGAKTVNIWREEFMSDFARRMSRCSDYSKSSQEK